MAISSSSFGNVRLTDDDARKFDRQVKFGRIRKEAIANAREGSKIAKSYKDSGQYTIKIKVK